MSRDLVKHDKEELLDTSSSQEIGRPSHAGSLTIMGICNCMADDELEGARLVVFVIDKVAVTSGYSWVQ
jgi:hypothetical protein